MSVEIAWTGTNVTARVVRSASDGSLALRFLGPEGIELAAVFADPGGFGLVELDTGPALQVGSCYLPIGNAEVWALVERELLPGRLQ